MARSTKAPWAIARFDKGVLKVVLPKRPEAASEQRKIEIKKASTWALYNKLPQAIRRTGCRDLVIEAS